MATTAATAQGVPLAPERPYPPGWFDRLIGWIDRMPGPNALYALVILVVQLAWMTGGLWSNGTLAVGSLDFSRTFLVAVAPYLLWVRFHLDRTAAAALEVFRPALSVGDAELQRLRYELTTLPARTTWMATAIAVGAWLVNMTMLPDRVVVQFGASRAAGVLVVGPMAVFTLAVVAASVAQVIRQLWMVDRIHRLAVRINLFRAKPLYAFSALAARTGVSLLLLTYYVWGIRPDIARESPAMGLVLVAMIPTAVACFILPLRGMHLRLAAEKDRLLTDASARYETLLARLHERVDQGMLADADKLNAQIAAVGTEREALARISSWPWEPATLTGFASALLLPVLLWAFQRALTRFGF